MAFNHGKMSVFFCLALKFRLSSLMPFLKLRSKLIKTLERYKQILVTPSIYRDCRSAAGHERIRD